MTEGIIYSGTLLENSGMQMLRQDFRETTQQMDGTLVDLQHLFMYAARSTELGIGLEILISIHLWDLIVWNQKQV